MIGLVLPGLFLLAASGMMAILSRSPLTNSGHEGRFVIFFLCLAWISFAAYFFATEWIRQQPADRSSPQRYLIWIGIVALLARLCFMISDPIQETDPNRYVWDGQMVRAGINPFVYSPEDAYENEVAGTHFNQEGQKTYQGINYVHVRTIYPPTAQFIFAISQLIRPWGWEGLRVLILLAEMGILILLYALIVPLKIRREWLLLYAWSPLILKEFANSLHVDVFAVLFLTLTLFLLSRMRPYAALAALALASGVKGYAVLLLPLILFWGVTHGRLRLGRGLCSFGLTAFILYLPFLSAGKYLFDGMSVFAVHWRVNEGLYGLIHFLISQLPIIPEGSVNVASRSIAASLILAVTVGCCVYLRQRRDFRDLVKVCLGVVASIFFLSPMGNPWYFTWLFPFLVIFPRRSLILFSGLVFFYYLDYYFVLKYAPRDFPWVRLTEYGLFYAILIYEMGKKIRSKST